MPGTCSGDLSPCTIHQDNVTCLQTIGMKARVGDLHAVINSYYLLRNQAPVPAVCKNTGCSWPWNNYGGCQADQSPYMQPSCSLYSSEVSAKRKNALVSYSTRVECAHKCALMDLKPASSIVIRMQGRFSHSESRRHVVLSVSECGA